MKLGSLLSINLHALPSDTLLLMARPREPLPIRGGKHRRTGISFPLPMLPVREHKTALQPSPLLKAGDEKRKRSSGDEDDEEDDSAIITRKKATMHESESSAATSQ